MCDVDTRAANDRDFEALYSKHIHFIRSTLAHLGVPSAAVEDALQDVFVLAHRRLSTFEGRSTTRGWLFGIARRVAYRYRRAAQRSERKARAVANEVTFALDLEAEFEHRQMRQRVSRALDDLDEDKRVAVILHMFEGQSGPELAATLGLNLDTAYSRIKAGRRALREALAHQHEGIPSSYAPPATRSEPRPRVQAKNRLWIAIVDHLRQVSSRLFIGKGLASSMSMVGALLLAAANGGLAARRAADTHASVPSKPILTDPIFIDLGLHSGMASADPKPPMASINTPARGRASIRPLRTRGTARGGMNATQPSPDPVNPADDLHREVELMTDAKLAIGRGEPHAALSYLDEYTRAFPEGQLRHEHLGYRSMALCAAGRKIEGRAHARAFIRDPSNTLTTAVTSACDLDPR